MTPTLAPPSPAAPLAELEPWLRARLEPLEPAAELGPAAGHSDFDLNPHAAPAVLTPPTAAAVLVGLVQRAEGLTVLLTRRADTLRKHTGQVAFPGGRCDPGETPAQTALREAQEEVGLDPAAVRLLGRATPYRTVTGFLVTPVVGLVRGDVVLTPSPAEVAAVFEPPFAWLMDEANHVLEHREPMGGGPARRFYAMPFGDQYIWGATAGMIRGLRDRLFG